VFALVAADVHRTSAFRWVRFPGMQCKEIERAASHREAKKYPVDTFLARGRVPQKRTAVCKTVGCF